VDKGLKTATTAVGLLAGVVAVVYLLGGVVISLRMLFDHFTVRTIATTVGQLPRELVVTTALLNVLAPAALIGLIAALIYGAIGRPRERNWENDNLNEGPRWPLAFVTFTVLALIVPVWVLVFKLDERPFSVVAACILGALLTFGLVATGWFLLRQIGRRDWSRFVRAACGGFVWAGFALVPMVLLTSSLPLEPAQVCIEGEPAPVKGSLIGEGGGHVLLGETFGEEAGVVSLPGDKVTRSEYGDIVTNLVCPGAPGAGSEIEAPKLGGHGSALEVGLAARLRPRLRFDSRERWRPLAVESLLGEDFDRLGRHRLCYGIVNPSCRYEGDLTVLKRGEGSPDFVDIAGSEDDGADVRSPNGECLVDYPAVDCNRGENAVIYYRRTTHEGRWYWDYWWFFRYSDYNGRFNDCKYYCGDHEGDWEGATVITTPSLQPEILGVVYAAHKERILVDAATVPRSGNHPLVFVASGTHASYPFRCAGTACRQYGSLVGFRLPEESHDGEIAWGGNVDASCREFGCVRPLPEVGSPGDLALPLAGGWAGWTGKWGRTCVQKCSRAESSPNSPGLQTRFKCPWAPTHWAVLSTDGTVSRAERAGDAERLRAGCEAQRAGL
jgi:hypothetical protein